MSKNSGVQVLPWADVIQALRGRTDWSTLRDALKAQALPVGTGWEDLAANCSPSQPVAQKLHLFLSSYYRELLLSGRRHIQLFSLEKEVVNEVDKVLRSSQVSQNAFHTAYPLPLPVADLGTQTEEPLLCGVHKLPSGDWALVFCSARIAEVREAINPADLDKRIADAFPGAHQLIAIRQVSYQAFDMAIVRMRLCRLELCMDVMTQ